LERICYFTRQKDLLNLRIVNRDFQEEATKSLKPMHKKIVLKSETKVQRFVKCMKERKRLELKPVFPFSNLEVTINMDSDTLEAFGPLCGPHVRKYCLRPADEDEAKYGEQMRNLARLLNFSPNVENLEVSRCETLATGHIYYSRYDLPLRNPSFQDTLILIKELWHESSHWILSFSKFFMVKITNDAHGYGLWVDIDTNCRQVANISRTLQ